MFCTAVTTVGKLFERMVKALLPLVSPAVRRPFKALSWFGSSSTVGMRFVASVEGWPENWMRLRKLFTVWSGLVVSFLAGCVEKEKMRTYCDVVRPLRHGSLDGAEILGDGASSKQHHGGDVGLHLDEVWS